MDSPQPSSSSQPEAPRRAEAAPRLLQLALSHPWSRVALSLFLLAAGLSMYAWLNRSLPPRVSYWLAVDGLIPFVPASLVAYAALHAMLPLAAWRTGPRGFAELAVGVLLANVGCYLGFLLGPAHYPRPAVASIELPWRTWYELLYAGDGPGNTFPSIHVATAVVVTASLVRSGGRAWVLLGAVVALSTLTTKQHFVADVLGGAAVGAVALGVARRAGRAWWGDAGGPG